MFSFHHRSQSTVQTLIKALGIPWGTVCKYHSPHLAEKVNWARRRQVAWSNTVQTYSRLLLGGEAGIWQPPAPTSPTMSPFSSSFLPSLLLSFLPPSLPSLFFILIAKWWHNIPNPLNTPILQCDLAIPPIKRQSLFLHTLKLALASGLLCPMGHYQT